MSPYQERSLQLNYVPLTRLEPEAFRLRADALSTEIWYFSTTGLPQHVTKLHITVLFCNHPLHILPIPTNIHCLYALSII